MGVEEGLAMFPKVQASYVKLGDLSLEMDHYTAKLGKVIEAAEKAVGLSLLDPSDEKLSIKKDKAIERRERNKEKLEKAKANVALCNDEFLQLCEDTELHRASIINDPGNLSDLIVKQKALFSAFDCAYGDRDDTTPLDEIPPPNRQLLRPPSSGLAKIKKGVRRRSLGAGVALKNLKKHGGRPKSGGEFKLENEGEYLSGEKKYLELKKDLSYFLKTMEKLPTSLSNVFNSLMGVAAAADVLANNCLDKDLVGEDDGFEGISAKAKMRTSQLIENIDEIKAALGSSMKQTSCYLSDFETRILDPLRPLVAEMSAGARFKGRKERALDHSHYEQKLIDQRVAKAKLEGEATEEKMAKMTENIARTTQKLERNKAELIRETDELLGVFEESEKMRESILTSYTSIYLQSTGRFWKHAAATLRAEINSGDVVAQMNVASGAPRAPPPAAPPPPPRPEADKDQNQDEEEGEYQGGNDDADVARESSSQALSPPPTVGEQSRRACNARLIGDDAAQTLTDDIEDVKEFGLESPPAPQVRDMSERTIGGESSEGAARDSSINGSSHRVSDYSDAVMMDSEGRRIELLGESRKVMNGVGGGDGNEEAN